MYPRHSRNPRFKELGRNLGFVISNTGASPIVGTFHNLSEGKILIVNGSNLQASYAGGDGNDLTLIVVP